jgi:hypothetical protein
MPKRKSQVLTLSELERSATVLAAQLGPDHPTVKRMKKELQDRKEKAALGHSTTAMNSTQSK